MNPSRPEPDDWAQVDAALDRALDLEPEARQTYLASLPEGRRARVAALFEQMEREGPLDRGVAGVATHLLEVADAALDPLAAGRRIGAWRLLRRLGAGGMGVVYLAERADGQYEHRAALKVVRWEVADPVLVQRFLAERQILARLSHPHIATLIDGGMTEEGLPYLVLEHVEGRPVDRHCEEGALPLADRLRLMATVCRAADFAHRQLVVHRDLKPSNVLVRSDGVPKLVDFGVAKLLDDAAGGDEPTRFAPLTPRYAAPEQLRGEAASVAADVWALGVMLAELATGAHPLEGAGDPERLAAAVRALGNRPELRGDLANIAARCLRLEPEARYRSAGELADDLDRFLAGRPVEATRPSVRYRLGKLVRRHRVASAALAAALLIAALGLGGVVWQAREARIERDAAHRQAVRAEQVTAFLRELFESTAPRVGGEPSVRDLLDEGAERIRTELDEAPAVRAELLETLGAAYKWLREFDRSEALLEEAVDLQERLAPGSEAHAMAMATLGGTSLHRGEAELAEARFLEALRLLDAAGVGRSAQRATVLNSLGMARLGRGEPQEAEAPLREAMAIYGELGLPERAMARANLALALDRRGRHEEAEPEHRAALAVFRAEWPSNATIPVILSNLAVNLSAQGRMEEAVATIQEAREIQREVPGGAVPLAETEANLAYLLLVAGRAGQSVELATSALAVLEERAPDATNTIATRANLGWALALEGRYDEALPSLERVVEELSGRFGPDHPVTGRGRTRWGAALHRAGSAAAAARQLDRAAVAVVPSAANGAAVADLALAQGALRCDTGRAEEGLEQIETALAAYEAVRGAEHWYTAQALVERSRCQAALGLEWSAESVSAARAVLLGARGPTAWSTRRADDLLR